MSRAHPYVTGWCGGPNHHLCPHLAREERTTPKGTTLPRLVCTCKCHKETR